MGKEEIGQYDKNIAPGAIEFRPDAKIAFFKAFNKCQGALSPVKTDSENPHFHSKYASLAAVMDAVKPFIEAGFSFIHEGVVLNGKPYLRTSLVYGGYERVSDLPLVDDGNPQHLASSSTYIKRQAVTGLTGLVADDDDDGNAATTAKPASRPAQAHAPAPAERPTGQAAAQVGSVISEPQGKRLYAMAMGAGKTKEQLAGYLKNTFGVSRSNELLRKDYETATAWAESKAEEIEQVPF